eukprot:6084790-Pleurochrysis_carterae.AAC.1
MRLIWRVDGGHWRSVYTEAALARLIWRLHTMAKLSVACTVGGRFNAESTARWNRPPPHKTRSSARAFGCASAKDRGCAHGGTRAKQACTGPSRLHSSRSCVI